MTSSAIEQALQVAIQHHQAGRLSTAEKIYRQVLTQEPGNANAWHLLGTIALQVGQVDAALELYHKAIALSPETAELYDSLGNALQKKGSFDDAIAAYRKALSLKPAFAAAYNHLGNALNKKGKPDEAVTAYRRALELNPKYAEAHNNLATVLSISGLVDDAIQEFHTALSLRPDYVEALGNLGGLLYHKGRIDEAIAAYRKVAALRPADAGAHKQLGDALSDKREFDEAITAYRRALGINPELAEAYNNLGIALSIKREFDEAITAFGQAIRRNPDAAEIHNNLGNALKKKGLFDEACSSFGEALRLKPDDVDIQRNMGNILSQQGKLDEAIALYRRALRLNPDSTITHSTLIFTLCFHPDYDAAAIRAETRRWDELHGQPVRKFIQPHRNVPDPDRRIKIGYVSSDLRDHVIGWNLLPCLRLHDRRQFEIVCYNSAIHKQDNITDEIRAQSDQWRDVTAMDDIHLADQIRADQIDVLVDLSLHTAGNRLVAFAMEPAPVQLTYLGYCSTSGVQAMHYRFSDPYLDPPDQNLSCYSEQTIRLPKSYWCYEPGGPVPEVASPPSKTKGYVTFGCLNQFMKVSSTVLELWRQILLRVPHSRLLLHAPPGKYLEAIVEKFGVGRIEFVGYQTWDQYMNTYHRIDIALDPFPYNGGITTCDTLLMGVPMIALSGRTSTGRGGSSILSNIGLPQLIAPTPQEYVQIAVDLANDLPRLVALRSSLRERIKNSPVMDTTGFVQSIEAAYRAMWQAWTARNSSTAR